MAKYKINMEVEISEESLKYLYNKNIFDSEHPTDKEIVNRIKRDIESNTAFNVVNIIAEKTP